MQRDSALPTPAAEALDLLYQHRLLSTPQLHELLAARYAERSVVRLLDRLSERGLAAAVQTRTETGRRGHRLRFLTEPGAEVAAAVPARPAHRRRLPPPPAA